MKTQVKTSHAQYCMCWRILLHLYLKIVFVPIYCSEVGIKQYVIFYKNNQLFGKLQHIFTIAEAVIFNTVHRILGHIPVQWVVYFIECNFFLTENYKCLICSSLSINVILDLGKNKLREQQKVNRKFFLNRTQVQLVVYLYFLLFYITILPSVTE